MLHTVLAALLLVQPVPHVATTGDTIPGTTWTREDWRIFDKTIRWAHGQRLDTIPVGRRIALIGQHFVGTTYTPGTLEGPATERLVINFRAFDCVTFVENALALADFVGARGDRLLAQPRKARATYEAGLRRLRYRGGVLDGYPSRLHYFSEWLADHAAAGFLELVTADVGAVPDNRPINFMTLHAAAYRQLADSASLEAIRAVEARLNAGPARFYIPKEQVLAAEPAIHDGDVLAMTSALPGLDVAHTGLAVIVDGRPHLLNAPLVGKNVELSPLPLAEHLAARSKQTGVMIGRVVRAW